MANMLHTNQYMQELDKRYKCQCIIIIDVSNILMKSLFVCLFVCLFFFLLLLFDTHMKAIAIIYVDCSPLSVLIEQSHNSGVLHCIGTTLVLNHACGESKLSVLWGWGHQGDQINYVQGLKCDIFCKNEMKKSVRFWKIDLLMLQSRSYIALNGPFPIELHTKHDFLKTQINKKTHQFFWFIHCARTKCSLSIQKSIPKVTLGSSNFCK